MGPTPVAVNTLALAPLLSPATLEEWPNGRIERVLLTMFVSPSTSPAAATGYGVLIGITSESVGVTTVSHDPETMLDHKWMWWNACFPQIGGTGAANDNSSRWIGYFRFDVDIRPRFRIQPDVNLSLNVKNSVASGAAIQYSFGYRVLIAAGAK